MGYPTPCLTEEPERGEFQTTVPELSALAEEGSAWLQEHQAWRWRGIHSRLLRPQQQEHLIS